MNLEREGRSLAEELADARLRSKIEVLATLESLTLDFLRAITRGDDPQLHLVREGTAATANLLDDINATKWNHAPDTSSCINKIYEYSLPLVAEICNVCCNCSIWLVYMYVEHFSAWNPLVN